MPVLPKEIVLVFLEDFVRKALRQGPHELDDLGGIDHRRID